jgi:hypothetical protein
MRTVTRYAAITVVVIAAFAVGYNTAPQVHAAAQSAKALIVRTIPADANQELPATRTTYALDPPLRLRSKPATDEVVMSKDVPLNRAGAQALARKTFEDFSKYVQNYEAGGYFSPHPNLYFLPSHYSGTPGICEATGISVDARPDGAIMSQNYYRIVGGFKSPPVVINKAKPGYEAYKRWEDEIKSNCEARDASSDWFTMGSQFQYHGNSYMDSPQVFDGVVAAARANGLLPFKLSCDSQFDSSHFCDDPRKSLAALNPGDIASISTRDDIDDKIEQETTIIETHGNPYVWAQVRRTSPWVPGGRIMWTVTDVEIHHQMQPIIR